jgi:hypothetical protein
MYGQRVWNDKPIKIDRLGQDRDIFDGVDRNAEPPAQALEVLNSSELKLPLTRLCDWNDSTSF